MVIPREGRLVRCYVQLSRETATAFKAHSEANVLIDLVKRILYPYSFEASQIEWSTIYSVRRHVPIWFRQLTIDRSVKDYAEIFPCTTESF